MKFLTKECNRIEYEVIPALKNKIETFFNKPEQATLEEKPDLNEIAEIIRKNQCNLKEMEKEDHKLRHELYRWG